MNLYIYTYPYESDCRVITNKNILVFANDREQAISLLDKSRHPIRDLSNESSGSECFEQSAYSRD